MNKDKYDSIVTGDGAPATLSDYVNDDKDYGVLIEENKIIIEPLKAKEEAEKEFCFEDANGSSSLEGGRPDGW